MPETEADVLRLQRFERALVRAHLAVPGVLEDVEVRRLRYLFAVARLTTLDVPGHPSLDLAPETAALRRQAVDACQGPLADERDARARLRGSRAVYDVLAPALVELRTRLLARHADRLGEEAFEREVGHRRLVLVLGGGGAAGYGHLGATTVLRSVGRTPDYVVGSSIGAGMGALLARELPVPVEDYIDLAAGFGYRDVLGRGFGTRRHGVRGPLSLRLDRTLAPLFRRPDGGRMRLRDTALPFDVLATGLRGSAVGAVPAAVMRAVPTLPGPHARWRQAALTRALTGPSRPVLLGADEVSRELDVLDAVSFSSALPGLIQHETSDPAMVPVLDAVLVRHGVKSLIDGSTVSNVPAEQAGEAVRAGRIGSRNVAVLALDCFPPQLGRRDFWYAPIAAAVGTQLERNLRYCDQLVRVPTPLAPSALAPGRAGVERAIAAGEEYLQAAWPVVAGLIEPVGWADVVGA